MTNDATIYRKTFIFGSSITLIGTILFGFINYFIRRTLALNLTAVEYGYFYSTFSLIMIIGLFLDLGLGFTLNVLLSKYDIKNEHEKQNIVFSQIFIIKLVLSSGICLGLILSSSFLMKYYFKYDAGTFAFILLSFYSITIALYGIIYTSLLSIKDYFASIIFQDIFYAFILFFILISIKTFKLNAAPLGYLIAGIIIILSGLIYLRYKHNIQIKIKSLKDKKIFQEIWKLGKWISFGIAGINALYYIDSLLLTYLTNLKEVALYNIALPITQIFQTMIIFPTVFIPIANNLWIQGQKEELGHITNIFIKMSIFLFWLILILILIIGKDIIILLFSNEYISVAPTLTILCSGIVFYAFGQFLIGIMNCSGKEKEGTILIIFAVIINIILSLILIPRLGIEGAAIATAMAYFIFASISYIRCKKIIVNISIHIKSLTICSLSGIAILCFHFINLYYKIISTRFTAALVSSLIYIILCIPVILPIIQFFFTRKEKKS